MKRVPLVPHDPPREGHPTRPGAPSTGGVDPMPVRGQRRPERV
jgi:hypothetical protein